MDKNQYNEHLTKFHADTFREYLIKREGSDHGYGQSPEQFIDKAFHSYIHVYNYTLAKPFLDSLKRTMENLTLSQQFDKISTDFPEIYLQSEDSSAYKRDLLNKFVNKSLTILFDQDEPVNFLKIRADMLTTLASFSAIVKDNEKNSPDTLASYTAFNSYLTEMYKISFTSSDNKDTPLIKTEDIKHAILDILDKTKEILDTPNGYMFTHALKTSLEEINKHLTKNQAKPLKVTI